MIHKRILKIGILSLIVAAGLIVTNPAVTNAFAPPSFKVMAKVTCKNGEVHPKDWNGKVDDNSCCPGTGNPSALQCLLSKYVNPLINLLAAIIGVVVVGSIIAAGIQYSSSQGDPSKVAAAKSRIFNSLLALAGFIFLFAFLQWLIPGGL